MVLLVAATAAASNVRDFGAKGDGQVIDTDAIQRAIDDTANKGGGRVEIPAGRYGSGTLFLRDNIVLHLHAGAVLLMSPADEDFASYEPPPILLSKRVTRYAFSHRGLARAANLPPTEDDSETTYMRHALLLCENVSNVTIEGEGRIDGNRTRRGGPKPIAIKDSRQITIRNVTIANAPNYAISLLGADFVTIDNVKISNAFADGIDPDNSHFVRISNTYVDSWDDAICPKASLALGRRHSTEHLTVTNCTLRTACSAFKFGTESAGSFKHVTVSNVTILPRENASRPPLAGIALESVDGADIEAVTISNITMRDVQTPIFLRLGTRGRGMDEPKPGSIRDVIIGNITATGARLASSITAAAGAFVRNVTLHDIHIESAAAAGTPSLDVPEEAAKYPEAAMFGDLPASLLYARHAEGLRLSNLTLRTTSPASRPAIVLDDVSDSAMHGIRVGRTAGDAPWILTRKVAGLLLYGFSYDTGAAQALRSLPPTSGIRFEGPLR
jgi:polygalacturonase